MLFGRCLLPALILFAAFGPVTLAAAPGPGLPTLAERTAKRFPQPVRVGDLIGRQVLEPTEAQHVLGRVGTIVRHADGSLAVIVRFGGVLGIGTRPIAVPVEAVALMGEYVAILDFTPDQLEGFPTSADAGPSLAPDDVIRVGLAKPFH